MASLRSTVLVAIPIDVAISALVICGFSLMRAMICCWRLVMFLATSPPAFVFLGSLA